MEKEYIYKDRFFVDDDPEFVSFFSGAVIDGDEFCPAYMLLSMGDSKDSIFNMYWDLDSFGLEQLGKFAKAMQKLYEAAEAAYLEKKEKEEGR